MKKRILSIASTIVLGFSIVSAQTETPVKSVSGGVLNGKATTLAKPPYPAAARAVNAEGAVSVQVLIDEEGNIASATAVSGHPLLRQAAEQAALQSKFAPTRLSGQPVKVSGVIVYNFTGGTTAQNWVKTGYDLASFERFAIVNPYNLAALSNKIQADWTNENEQLKQLQTIAGKVEPPQESFVAKNAAPVKIEEKSMEAAEKRIEGEMIKRNIFVRTVGAPPEASAEQTAIIQNLASSLQSRLGSDPKSAWQLNFGIALGRALTNAKNAGDQQSLIESLRQQIAAAPGDVTPQYLESANKIIAILETKNRTPEQRAEIGQLLSSLFKN